MADTMMTGERTATIRSALPSLGPKATAAAIRPILRKAFPGVKFSVTTGRGSMVSAVDVRWTDGPTTKSVKALVSGFEAGTFDGMTDSYEYDRDTVLSVEGTLYRPGTRYVMEARTCSKAFTIASARAVLAQRWAFPPGVEAQIEAALAAWEASPPETERLTANAFWSLAQRTYPGYTEPGWQQGRDLGQMIHLHQSDTAVEVA